ncbi:BREX-1 system adenine-specific DNA-methyltransferase PglX, partial [Desulfosarcina sp.]|nr:BREX-1 system adenine-specific DNA-methyltransferase PglX [Desulfosarcina sp.]
ERKDEVMGKIVKSEDIPAATQLFTPNWIVKYMVQNTLGRMWLATYPDSPLKDKMEYYIEPADQQPEVQEQLYRITPKELNPEEITFLDPACGSGHILIEAYDIFKEIYLERGYRTRDIPRLILEKNIFGLDICDRAAQLACFAILMKSREDDRKILERIDLILNVMAIQETIPSDARNIELFFKGNEYSAIKNDLNEIVALFRKGKNFGSLITVPEHLVQRLDSVEKIVDDKIGKWIVQSDVKNLATMVKQARFLARKYDCVVTNPPYMSSKGMNPQLKVFAKNLFPDSKNDIFSMFSENIVSRTEIFGYIGLVMPYVWMFLSSYESFRNDLITKATLKSLIQLEYNAFEPACVPVASFILFKHSLSRYKGDFIKLSDFKGYQNQAPKVLEAIQNPFCGWRYTASSFDFKKIIGSPICYWASKQVINLFNEKKTISKDAKVASGLQTSDNNRFLRRWFEVSWGKIGFNYPSLLEAKNSGYKWFPHKKGGAFRKWFGNDEYIVNWENDGEEIREWNEYKNSVRTSGGMIKNVQYYFKEGVTWSHTSSSLFSARYMGNGYIFNVEGPSLFSDSPKIYLSYLCSAICLHFMKLLNPTLHFFPGTVASLPFIKDKIRPIIKTIEKNATEAIDIAIQDWDSFCTSWGFKSFPMLISYLKSATIEQSFQNWESHCINQIKRMQELETENNRLFIEVYGLQNQLNPEVPEDQITLTLIDREAAIKEIISYSIGCMMGRYSLDHPGLIYAHSGNIDFDPSKYKALPADDDGIIPIMDQDWFPDDATNRFVDFLKAAWSTETLDENLEFVANTLKPKRNEISIETIRRYMSTTFFKDHLKTYKKRPIYWLFSSGKQKAFECLVYLHRYNESTLSRIRSTYVTPLQSNFSSRLDFLQDEKDSASTASAKNKIQKEIDKLKKKQAELSNFDDELRHYADMKISLDLDDGVKINYKKFGNLLAMKKAITGKN